MSKIIVIPDVHGRTFWKDGVKGKGPDDKIIFLGDYLDPYYDILNEDIRTEMIDNLKEIIDLKKKDPDHVVLLIGNHDRHYMDNCKAEFSRFSIWTKKALDQQGISFDNDSLFQVVYEENINGKRFIFSHAGIHRDWIDGLFGSEDIDTEQINLAFFDDQDGWDFDEVVSVYRGGFCAYGSILWADIREYANEVPYENTVQVFGHTQLEKDPINFKDSFYCLDVRRPFIITEDGVVREMDGNEILKTEE